MYRRQKILATVCARGGSKGVKNKNILSLGGKPVICYSLDCIKQSAYIDDYIISTESDDIIDVVKSYGFSIKFKRPEKLARDKVFRLDVVKHAVEWLEKFEKKKYDIIIDLGVATPLKNAEDLDAILECIVNNDYSNIISVTRSARNPYYNMVEVIDGKVSLVKSHNKKITDRRDAPIVYDMNDAFSAWKRDVLFSSSPQFNNKSFIYEMPSERSVDIDEEIDLKLAKAILENNG